MKIDSIYLENFKNENKIYNERLLEIKPAYRGWLHLKVSYLLSYFISILLIFKFAINGIDNYTNLFYDSIYLYKENLIEEKNNQFIIFLCLILYTYFSSALFHNYKFKTEKCKELLEILLMNDLFGISTSVYAKCFIFISYSEKYMMHHLLNIFLIMSASIFILKDNKVLLSKWDMFRMINLTIHSIYGLFFIGEIIKYNILWKLSSFNYLISTLSYGFKQIKYKPMYWHQASIYGYHEDFHLFLFIGDIMIMLSIIQYLYQL